MAQPTATTRLNAHGHASEHSFHVDVKAQYAATGDGSTEDANAIQAAINTGLPVYLQAGTYNIAATSLTLATAGQRIYGAGRDKTIIKYTGTGSAIKTADNATNLTHLDFSDFTIDCRSATAGYVMLELDNIARSSFRNLRLNGTGVAGTGIKLIGSATKSTTLNSFYDITIACNTACVDVGDACNANRFFGGLYEGTGYSVYARPGTTPCATNLWVGTAMHTTGATIIQLGGTGVNATDNQFLGCRLEPGGAAAIVCAASDGLRNTFIGGTWDNNVTITSTTADGNVFIVPQAGIFRYEYINQSDAKTTIDLRGTSANVTGITMGTDTNLYRSAANTLKTDDGLVVTGDIELDGALNHDGTTVGFYGTAPTTQQTGVAVTAAAIHAALVNLGLITA